MDDEIAVEYHGFGVSVLFLDTIDEKGHCEVVRVGHFVLGN